MQIAFFGSSLLSAYWNGAATYYRGMLRALHARGHTVSFYEPNAYQRQQNRDMEAPEWAKVVVYQAEEDCVLQAIERARGADLIVKASGVGVFDELLEREVLNLKNSSNLVVFWDVDAPATLERVLDDLSDQFRSLIPLYDAVLTYGGGEPVVNAYRSLGAHECIPIYNALDPETHYRVEKQAEFEADLAFMGNRLPDREARVEEFFLGPASCLPSKSFLLGGAGWADRARQSRIRYLDHVYTRDHNGFNSSPLAVLNVSRESMARYGFSPATRVFEAAGAGACLITDAWEGVEDFFEPGKEILIARDGEDVIELLAWLDRDRATSIGEAALHRALASHTYAQRAAELDHHLDMKGAAV